MNQGQGTSCSHKGRTLLTHKVTAWHRAFKGAPSLPQLYQVIKDLGVSCVRRVRKCFLCCCCSQLYPYSMSTQIAGFENVGLSMLSVFQAMTLTNWSFTMYRTMDFLSPAVVIYWFVLIIFGAYFVVSVCVCVVWLCKKKNLCIRH